MRDSFVSLAARAVLALAATGLAGSACAAARSHAEALAIADAPGQHVVQSDGDAAPFWRGAYANAASTSARATGTFLGNLGPQGVDVAGSFYSRADFGGIKASGHTEMGPLNDPFGPVGGSNGQAWGQLWLDWTISGPAGAVGSISVSGSLFAASYVGNPLGTAWGSGSSSIMADLSRDCGGPYCGVYGMLDAKSDGPTPVIGYQQKDYTLTLPVQVGDHVSLVYTVSVTAGSGATAWAGTVPAGVLPGAAAATALGGAADPSFAQQIWLTGGLALDSPEGLTRLSDGRYGFGDVSGVPEPGTWALCLAGAGVLLGRVCAGRCGERAGDRA